jgi:plastocyanin
MKKISIFSMSALLILFLLTSCSGHLGLSKMFGSGGSSTKPAKTKKVKATHTPPSPAGASAEDVVTITSAGYQPNNLPVKVGAAVTWTNTDAAAHTVTSDTAGVFDSGPIAANAKFTFTFSQAGTFTYHSTGDASITGTIVVAP